MIDSEHKRWSSIAGKKRKERKMIGCTEPRRVDAISMSKRVAHDILLELQVDHLLFATRTDLLPQIANSWCQSTSMCEVADQCLMHDEKKNYWLNRSQTCPNPKIDLNVSDLNENPKVVVKVESLVYLDKPGADLAENLGKILQDDVLCAVFCMLWIKNQENKQTIRDANALSIKAELLYNWSNTSFIDTNGDNTKPITMDDPLSSTSSAPPSVNLLAIGRHKYDVRYLKLKQIHKPKMTAAVWEHFGTIQYDGETIKELQNNIYCKICFEKKIFKNYRSSTGTSNLHDHLTNIHQMVLKKATTDQNQMKINKMLFSNEAEVSLPKRDAQFMLNRQMCLWLCRDLVPFQAVEKPGFSALWKYFTKWLPFTLPSRATVSNAALNDVYESTKRKLIDILQTMPTHASITFDTWTDKYKKRQYITFTYHSIDDKWNTRCFMLKTALFADSSVASNVQNEYLKVIEEFQLEAKKISLVTDSGSNMLSASRKLELPHFPCIAHKVHNLISDDLLKNPDMAPISALANKLSSIQTALLYAHAELEEAFLAKQNEELMKFLLEVVDFESHEAAGEQYGDNGDRPVQPQERAAFSGLKSFNRTTQLTRTPINFEVIWLHLV